eukprot:4726996-Prymnesium_polylepis.1
MARPLHRQHVARLAIAAVVRVLQRVIAHPLLLQPPCSSSSLFERALWAALWAASRAHATT